MKRYVSVKHSAAGGSAVTVSLVDGELSARWTLKTYIGDIKKATHAADRSAHRALEEIRAALESEIEES